MRVARSGFTVAMATLSLVAANLIGPTAAQAAATPCSAGTRAQFEGCWYSGDSDVLITLSGHFTATSRVTSSGGRQRTIDLAGFDVIFGGGIQVSPADTLIIADSVGTGTLLAGASSDGAAIGGDADPTLAESAGTIVVNGGNVTAAGTDSAGIGGGASSDGQAGSGGTVTINGGTVNAQATNAPGIGGGTGVTANGIAGAGGTVTINGGSVAAVSSGPGAGIGGGYGPDGGAGGTVAISGGSVTAASAGAAGIGGGNGNSVGTGGAGGTVTITGGTVEATSGNSSAGIGGAYGETGGAGAAVTIAGGIVTVTGGSSAAGIGGGAGGGGGGGTGGTVTITGGVVNATAGSFAAGIGGGGDGSGGLGGDGGTFAVHGGDVTVAGGEYAPGVGGGFGSDGGDGGTVIVTGGTVEASGLLGGAGIGGAAGLATAGDGAEVTVTGGVVKAVGGLESSDPDANNGAGIGSGMALGTPGQPGSLTVGGLQGSGTTQTTGGAGGTSTRVPDISFATTGSAIAVVTPVSGTPAGLGSVDIGFLLPPSAPAITSITAGRSDLSVYFTPPADDGGAPVDTYDYSTDGGTTWTTRDPSSTASPLVVAGLTAGRNYQVRIRARNAAGTGTASDPFIVATLPPAGKRKQQLRPRAVPKRIKNHGTTVVNKRNARTVQNQPVRVEVRILSTRGDLRCLRVIRGPQRTVKIRAYGTCTARIRVVYRAPATADYYALRVAKNYRIRG